MKRFKMKSQFLPFFSVIGEDLKHRCFRKEHYMKTVTQPYIIHAVFANNYCIQIIEQRYVEQFYASLTW